MADGLSSTRDVSAPSGNFREVAELAGVKLRERLSDGKDSATKLHVFDAYQAQNYQDILDPVLSHEVSDIALHQMRSSSLSLPCRNSVSGTVAGSWPGSRSSSRLRRSYTTKQRSVTPTHQRIPEGPSGYWHYLSIGRMRRTRSVARSV